MRRKHHDLVAWQQAIAPVKDVYRLSGKLPDSEKFGLASQMQRAAVSVPANIAEGVGRQSAKERARGSLTELETHAIIVKELGLVRDVQQVLALIDRVFALINGLMNAERRKAATK
jgi:four helix bundle protein